MPSTYGLNQVVEVTAVVTVNATKTDPTGITLHVRAPDATENSFTYTGGQLTRDGVGEFHYDIPADQVGVWAYQWETTGTAAGGSPAFEFMVGETPFSTG